MLDKVEVDKDFAEIAGGRCPECHADLQAIASCGKCGFRLPAGSTFCPGCGEEVDSKPSPAALRAHAESHWGKDFDKATAEKSPHLHFDEKQFPDACRRWKMVIGYGAGKDKGN